MPATDDLLRQLKTNDECLQYLFALRFRDPVCPRCGRTGKYYRHSAKQCFSCACGGHHIYPRQGTLFSQSPLPLPVWFQAIADLIGEEPHRPITQLAREWHVSYATAWRMTQRITHCLEGVALPITLPEALAIMIPSGMQRPEGSQQSA